MGMFYDLRFHLETAVSICYDVIVLQKYLMFYLLYDKGGVVMEIIAVCNRRGGCAKSTTCSAMFSYLDCIAKKRTLLIDMDAQCNSSYSLGANLDADGIYDVLMGKTSADSAMQTVPPDLFHGFVLSASPNLSDIDNGFESVKINLRSELETLEDSIDYVIIDTAPSLGTLTVLALSVADKVIIPVMADVFGLSGIGNIYELITAVKEDNHNHNLSIEGILLTRYKERLLVNRKLREMITETAEQIGTKLFNTKIRDGVAIAESAMMQQGLFDYDKKRLSNVAQDYEAFMKELGF